ncbi:hypothetical protein [Proteiniclasticum ruminis]|uniref:Zinc-ribbon containing domain-containing protein n=1 Tax=Proteiniclasticum ruminis TaxID=398199 RepID=A0A1I5ANC8_9CLOT|nr:hypothetical protein [Proteiniclasticum ruminis]SFN63971.1 hypothetical protein SAMN04488695_103108 [Proteiniclasticum ruminis]
MNYKISHYIFLAGLFLGVIFYTLAASIGEGNEGLGRILSYLSIGTLLLGLLQYVLYYRCPHCKKPLISSKGRIPVACPHCKKEL